VTAHVLVVEDNDLVASAMRLLMESGGHRVSMARTAAEARAVALADEVDLMLLDLTLPDGDGLHLLAELAEAGRSPRTTVLLTGHEEDATRRRALSAGCSDVWIKPVPARELLERVRRLTD
jgi:DNA-binding response OmpR family regulator